ncbi:DUF2752 domain-containing protein [Luteimonas sp. 100069]|uniref:DUF2752 domain-containing protein n=1 Tax=Luteimonas sp. 100069 TaxID=2006109 RepID=UPI000F4FB2EF|nr:DUF2752 domain-containing protein [Luteimonas sp. 100069]RPD87697.1 DUF2752 domain-containing protein [Luteimonas sp. 100069]
MSLAGSHAPRRIRASTVALAGGGLALAAGGAWLLRTFDPNAPGNPFPACMFYSATGWHCPGCGLTRSLHALVHGDLPRAFSMNPLLLALLALAPLLAAWHLGWRPTWLQHLARIASDPRPWVALVLVYWVARNLPWAPFTLLAPG